MRNRTITLIDETIREGMQYRGVVFSREQRENILEFQERLCVDICQAGYAPAHITEQQNITHLNHIVQQKSYKIRIAGMGRASIHDVDDLVNTGIADFHLHAHIKAKLDRKKSFQTIREAICEIKTKVPDSRISIAVLDIGTSSPELLEMVSTFLVNELCIDILSLPDTSGIMSPISFYNAITNIVSKIGSYNKDCGEFIDEHFVNQQSGTEISVHCHNDLGMASANTLMGVKAGATVVELSALGIGERNGIGDIFTVGRMLKSQGYEIRLDTDNIKIFKDYYQYVSDICKAQTGESLLNYNTPFFGNGVRTHVAGTHAGSDFGLFNKKDADLKEAYYLNVLCGKKLVKQYLESNSIPYRMEELHSITEKIKSKSAELGRRLEKDEIMNIVLKI